MKVGIPKERKRDERRVALRPDQARVLVQMGHELFVEYGAGEAAGYGDTEYARAGATLVVQQDVYQQCNLLLKVKCPLPEEYSLLREDHVLFCYLHFDENILAERIRQIVATGVTGIAYEWVRHGRRYPLLEPMSELCGATFARHAMTLLMTHKATLGGRYLKKWPASTAMVIGVGNIGRNAINVLARNEFEIVVVDKHPETLENRICQNLPRDLCRSAIKHVVPFDEANPKESAENVRRWLPIVEIVLCAAVRRPTLPKERLEYIIRKQDVATMSPNSVICDATACDRDLIETCVSSDSLTHYDVVEGVIHYNCDHIPSLVASTATHLLTEATFPYIVQLANGFIESVQENPGLAAGVMCHREHLTHEYSAQKKSIPHTPLEEIIVARSGSQGCTAVRREAPLRVGS